MRVSRWNRNLLERLARRGRSLLRRQNCLKKGGYSRRLWLMANIVRHTSGKGNILRIIINNSALKRAAAQPDRCGRKVGILGPGFSPALNNHCFTQSMLFKWSNARLLGNDRILFNSIDMIVPLW